MRHGRQHRVHHDIENVADVAHEAGVKLASGSDVVGPWQGRRGEELMYKARVLGAHEALISATRVNAELFMLEDEIGTVETGKRADFAVLEADPFEQRDLAEEQTEKTGEIGHFGRPDLMHDHSSPHDPDRDDDEKRGRWRAHGGRAHSSWIRARHGAFRRRQSGTLAELRHTCSGGTAPCRRRRRRS